MPPAIPVWRNKRQEFSPLTPALKLSAPGNPSVQSRFISAMSHWDRSVSGKASSDWRDVTCRRATAGTDAGPLRRANTPTMTANALSIPIAMIALRFRHAELIV